MQAVILAGGKGKRLYPLTAVIPKPLMPINETPILEIVLRQLKNNGFNDVIIAVNYMADLIMAIFGKGEKFGLNITYSVEDKPLGTAGPLSLIENLDDDFLVMNGDLLTTINYADLFDYHKKNNNDATISSYKKEVKIDLGVLKIEDGKFTNYIEKPTYKFDVSMGIYIFNKSTLNYLKKNEQKDMPDLMLNLKQAGKKVGCYQGDYYWLDIGRREDYEQAVEIFEQRKKDFLPDE
jgi:NDP-sugar pyrophosphorylase family protein